MSAEPDVRFYVLLDRLIRWRRGGMGAWGGSLLLIILMVWVLWGRG